MLPQTHSTPLTGMERTQIGWVAHPSHMIKRWIGSDESIPQFCAVEFHLGSNLLHTTPKVFRASKILGQLICQTTKKNIKVVGVFTFHIFSYHSQIVCFLYHFLWNYLMFFVVLSVCRKTNILIFKRCRQTNLLDNLDLMSRKTRWVESSLLLLTSLLLCPLSFAEK